MIATRIGDGGGHGFEAQIHKANGDLGLKVFTENLRVWENDNRFFSNSEYGLNMGQDASAGGTPLRLHDGNDSSLWTGSNIIGTSVSSFSDTTRPYLGTQSVRVDNPSLSDTFQFAKGSDQDLTNYVSVTIWINVDRRWSATNEEYTFYGWDTGTGLVVGNAVNLTNYFTPNSFDVWQLITIPLSDLGLTGQTVDAFRFTFTQANGTSPRFYLDEFELQESGPPIVFSIEPEQRQALQVFGIDFTLVDAYDARLTDSSVTNLAFDQLLSVGKLPSGITISRIVQDETVFSATVTCLYEFLRISGEIRNVISDGTNTAVTIRIMFSEPIELRGQDLDKITIQIADNLSGLTEFNAFALGRSREVH